MQFKMYFNDRTAAHASAVHVSDLLYLYFHAFWYIFFLLKCMLFLLTIVLCIPPRYANSDCPFGIFPLFLSKDDT
jgi:hypothetical protein